VSGTTPWWTALAAAGGALIGAWLTQWRTDKRWRQERTDRQAQWDREKRDRREQWEREDRARREQFEREDRARWHSERHGKYSAAVTAVERWGFHALPGAIDPDGLEETSESARRALGDAFIVASAPAVEALRRLGKAVGLITYLAGEIERFEQVPAGFETDDDRVRMTSPGFSAEGVVSDGARLIGAEVLELARAELDVAREPSKRTLEFRTMVRDQREGWRDQGRQLVDHGRSLIAMDLVLEMLAPDPVTIDGPKPRRPPEP
jgi:hypothetical protein